MVLEVLFAELGGLYGDGANVRYLQACAPELQVVYTDNRQPPRFVTEKVDMLYLGSMTEKGQEIAVQRLLPYRDRLRELIEDGTVVLATGNALEIFGEYIADGERHTEMLGLFPFHADRRLEAARHNSLFIGRFEDMRIVGCKSQFSFCRGQMEPPFIRVIGGYGNHPGDPFEGIRYRNFYATYLLGPLLVLNPPFTKHLLRQLHLDDTLAFEKEAMDAYTFRLEQLEQPGVNFLQGEHG